MKYYTPNHQWIDLNAHRVGVSSFAKNELGEIVYLQLPQIGDKVSQGDELCILESTKAASDVYAPYSGTVTAINNEAIQHINEDPESLGWLVELTPEQTLDASEFLDLTAYQLMLES
jgi:glycine cleavage system H protein